MNKKQVRVLMIEKLKTKNEQHRKKESLQICKRAIKLIPKNTKVVSIYHPYEWEVDNSFIKKYLKKQNIIICYPKILNKKQGYMKMYDENDCLWTKKQIDIVFIPCIAFYKNDRLGYGFGFYDKFLKKYKGKKYLLAFTDQKFKFEIESHDVKIQRI